MTQPPHTLRRPGAVLAIGAIALTAAVAGPASAAPLAPFSTALPLPPSATPTAANHYRLTIRQTTQQFHPSLGGETSVWGYDDGVHGTLYPGPTIEIKRGSAPSLPTTVEWVNDLPAEHLFPVDTRLTPGGISEPHTLTHLHGGFVSGADDGNPFASPGTPRGGTQTVGYPNMQPSSTLWYHDHEEGMTRLNVMGGLAGYYLLRDDQDTGDEPNPIGIPGGRYEVPLAIQDRAFTADGQISYPTQPAPLGPWVPEFFGNVVAVNGAVTPFHQVEPRQYRLRILNGSNARFYNLEIGGSPRMWQIGTDQGLLTAPVRLKRIAVAPGERADVIVDFSRLAGQRVVMRTAALPAGVVSPAPKLTTVMQFRVGTEVTAAGPASVPESLPGDPVDLPSSGFAATRNITLEEVLDSDGEPVRLELDGKRFMDPPTQLPRSGTVEEWRFANLSADTHPMHLHLQRFQVVDRWSFDSGAYAEDVAEAREEGDPNPNPLARKYRPRRISGGVRPEERGWKDTVPANPRQVTRIRVKFDLPEGVTAPQDYVFHCHILEHEDNDMMRPYRVIP